MPLARYQFNPGINREGTALTAEGGWYDGNLVRFRKGFPEKIGGWEKATENSYLGTGRLLHGWVTVGGTNFLDWVPVINCTYKKVMFFMTSPLFVRLLLPVISFLPRPMGPPRLLPPMHPMVPQKGILLLFQVQLVLGG